MSRPLNKVFSLDGNIGSGKSTLLEVLKKEVKELSYGKQVVFVDEPVNEWESIKDKDGVSILSKFYKDQKKYSFSFQIMAYISRLASLQKAMRENPHAIIITERSIFTDRHVFAQMLHDDGLIEDVEFQIYCKWFNHFMEDIGFCGMIYVNTDPEVCYERIKSRNRTGEETIPLEYLKKCDDYHKKYTKYYEYSGVHALYLNGNVNKDTHPEEYENHIHNVKTFLMH